MKMSDKKKLKEDDRLSVRGDLHITEYEILVDANGNPIPTSKEDPTPMRGRKIGEFEEKNVVLRQGISFILQAFASAANSNKTRR